MYIDHFSKIEIKSPLLTFIHQGYGNNGVPTPLNNSFDPNAGLSLRILPSTYINIRLFDVYLPILPAGRL